MVKPLQFHGFDTRKQAFIFPLIIICLLFLATPALAQDSVQNNAVAVAGDGGGDQANTPAPVAQNLWNRQYLLGDWGGARTRLEEEKGIKFDFFYISDMLYANNGIHKDGGAAWNRVRGSMWIDFGKLAGLNGLKFFVTGLWQGGPNLGANYLGSISNPSGLVSQRTEMLDSYWLSYSMLDEKVELKAGQFASMDYYALCQQCGHFLMEPLDYGFNLRFNDYASFDPASGPGVMLTVHPYKWMSYSVAYTSGNRNPYYQDPNGFHFVKHNSGVISDNVIFQINNPSPGTAAAKEKYYPGQYEVGSTYNGGKFSNPFCSATTQVSGCPAPGSQYYSNPLYYSPNTGNYVFYVQGTQAVYRPQAGSSKGLDVLFGFSLSPNTPYNFADKNILAGFVYNGPINSRPKDSIGFALSYSHVSDKYANYYAATNPTAPRYSSEKAFEFNYAFQATPYWLIQPTVQWYTDVGGFSHYGTATAVGFRTKVTF